MRLRAALVALIAIAGCAHVQPVSETDRSGFVDAGHAIPGLVVDMRYAGAINFVGRPIAGYEAPVCLLTRETVEVLAVVQTRLQDFGLGLKVYDCYRPKRAVADFVAWAKDVSDQKRKAEQYPNVDKTKLFELGYIAERSGHSRGSTLDLTLVDARTGAEVDMGSGYDLFDTISWPSDQRVSPSARANRMLLQTVMTTNGFKPLKGEWWHFTLKDEPYPETYFDFVGR
ncbi:MAG: M15 family metallopeptidase [Hyphomonadaceae bacterium]